MRQMAANQPRASSPGPRPGPDTGASLSGSRAQVNAAAIRVTRGNRSLACSRESCEMPPAWPISGSKNHVSRARVPMPGCRPPRTRKTWSRWTCGSRAWLSARGGYSRSRPDPATAGSPPPQGDRSPSSRRRLDDRPARRPPRAALAYRGAVVGGPCGDLGIQIVELGHREPARASCRACARNRSCSGRPARSGGSVMSQRTPACWCSQACAAYRRKNSCAPGAAGKTPRPGSPDHLCSRLGGVFRAVRSTAAGSPAWSRAAATRPAR
jgi:hypothetical protein